MMQSESKGEISLEGDTIISEIGKLTTAHSAQLWCGQVFLGYKNADESKVFAIKVTKKSEMANENLMSQVISERNVLALSTGAECVRSFYSLQMPLHVFLVMEDTIACNLKSLIAAYGNDHESAALFYCAEITLALEYLHSHGIIRRHIKPDNSLLLSQTGHVKLADFSLNKIEISRDLKLSDFIATSPCLLTRTPDQLLSLTSHLTIASNEPKFRNCLKDLMNIINRQGSPDDFIANLQANKSASSKRARTESSSDVDGFASQPMQKKAKLCYDFELFATEILEKIFIRMDDAGLLNLANTCIRFEAIAQTIFSKRYANSYFHLNAECDDGESEMYTEIFNRFGSHIKAIQLNGDRFSRMDSTHWALEILQSQINQLEKLTYNDCFLDANGIILQPLNNATHLAFWRVGVFSTNVSPERYWYCTREFDLPECRNLVELELRDTWCTRKSLKKMIENNPALQRIVLENFNYCESEEGRFSIIDSIAEHLSDVKELALRNNYNLEVLVSDSSIVSSFMHLESLFMDLNDNNALEFVPRLGNECKSLKHLGLSWWRELEIDFEILRPFQQIESLHLEGGELIPIGLPVEDFPKLRHLTIESETIDENLLPSLLPLLQQSQSLERITMVFFEYLDCHMPTFISTEFFEQFIATIAVTGKPNAQIEVVKRDRDAQIDEMLGRITANGLVWRNKLMYWKGCDYDVNSTKIHLLDLAGHYKNQCDNIEDPAEPMSLLDTIFDYLDLESLAQLVEANGKSKRLVDNYITLRIKQQKALLFTDEFLDYEKCRNFYASNDSSIFQKLEGVRMMTDLNVCARKLYVGHIASTFKNNCKLLNKISIYEDSRWSVSPSPQTNIPHVVYDCPYSVGFCKLTKIIAMFPQVETIEFKNANRFTDIDRKRIAGTFGSLKTFTFNYRDETQMKNLEKIFANTTVQLVPVYRNLA